jgi:DNA-binding transcriptional ArsR family regulator
MSGGPNIATVAALLGDPGRANIVTALMGGQALTAKELARAAGVTAQTASGHLARLLDGGLLAVARQGRHRYYRLAGPAVANAVEGLMVLAGQPERRIVRVGPRDPALRQARVCYDHLAGEAGVALFQRLCERGMIALAGADIDVTAGGEARLASFGIDVAGLRSLPRPLCRSCLDWSERRPHLAGALGAALLTRFLDLGWLRRAAAGRALVTTQTGAKGIADLFR